jgi:anti-anti-sigma factor
MSPLFEVIPSDSGTLRLVGELDLGTVSVLTDAIEQMAPANGGITLDLSELTFIDSSGLHALATCAKALDGKGPLILANPTSWVLKVFELVGFPKYPPIEIRQAA